jgi:hypothetical protein
LTNFGNLNLEASTVVFNWASFNGGGLYNSGQAKILNTTMSGNIADQDGAAIYNSASASLRLASNTLANNSADRDGGGIFEGGGESELRNTILSGNTAGATGGNCRGSFDPVANTLVSSNDCGLTGTLIVADPLLGDLQDNGGPTQTHALAADSPAIDAVPIVECTDFAGVALTRDQRGMTRPVGIACDIGAYEYGFDLFLPLIRR